MARVTVGTPDWGDDLNADIGSVEASINNHKAQRGSANPHELTPSDIGAATATHAASHATGGSDPITPASIGAVPADDPRLLDTGWREMPADEWISETAFPVMSKRRLRRVGNTVWAGLEFEYEADKFSYRPSATPLGFRPDLSGLSFLMAGYSGEPIQIGVFGLNSSGTTFMRTRPGIGSASSGYFTASWTTSDPWPTTLPGTPA